MAQLSGRGPARRQQNHKKKKKKRAAPLRAGGEIRRLEISIPPPSQRCDRRPCAGNHIATAHEVAIGRRQGSLTTAGRITVPDWAACPRPRVPNSSARQAQIPYCAFVLRLDWAGFSGLQSQAKGCVPLLGTQSWLRQPDEPPSALAVPAWPRQREFFFFLAEYCATLLVLIGRRAKALIWAST